MGDQVSADPRIGTELAGYRIERLLGRGGMSVVYLAEDTRLERKVALKLLAPELSEDARFRERFLRESKLAASLDHPNVIPIFEAGEAGGVLFIAMRFVEGGDLKRLLAEEGRLEPARAVGVLERVADALDAAHKRGLVHRDVKPGNVLISEDGHVYLSDFGLTKQAGSESGVTQTGQFMGTADYVAPEQIEHQDVSEQTDQYALACVLYECLTGQAPFRGESLMGVLWGHVNTDPRPASERNPELPAALDAVLARGMAKEPLERYPTCSELVGEARASLGLSGEVAAPMAVRSRRGRWVAAALVLVVAVVAAVVLAVVLTGGGDDAPAVGPVTTDSLVRVDLGTEEVAAVIPVGRRPAWVAASDEWVLVANRDDGTVSIVDPGTNAVTGTVAVTGTPLTAAVDGDTGWVAATSGGQGVISQLDLETGRVRRTVEVGFPDPVAVSVDEGSLWVAAGGAGRGGIVRIDTDSLEVVATIPVEAADPWHLIAAHGAVWFTQWQVATNSAESGIVRRIDSATNEVVAAVQLPVTQTDARVFLAAGPEAVWAADFAGPGEEIWRIDPSLNGVTETINLENDRVVDLPAFADGLMWIGVEAAGPYDPRGSPYAILGIDLSTEQTTSRIEVIGEDDPAFSTFRLGLVPGADSVWFVTQQR